MDLSRRGFIKSLSVLFGGAAASRLPFPSETKAEEEKKEAVETLLEQMPPMTDMPLSCVAYVPFYSSTPWSAEVNNPNGFIGLGVNFSDSD
jgi:hypothetical protein